VILHVIVCVLLVLIVLLQRGKGANMGAAFGGSSSTIFGSSGPGTFLSKITTVVALVFMLTSLYLAYFTTSKGRSVVERAPKPAAEQPASKGLPAPSPAPAGTPAGPGQPAGQNR
jgi:preprotein translocase subunit SecG